MKKPLKIPKYFKDLPDDANLNSRDVAEMFGYKTVNALHAAVLRGSKPKPNVHFQCGSVRTVNIKEGTVGTHHVFWTVGYIKEYIENVNRNPTK